VTGREISIGSLIALAAILVGCGGDRDRPREPSPAPLEREWFVDQAAASGLEFVHVNGASGRFYQPEISGSGAALFDYDNDGDLDIWLVQGGSLDRPPAGAAGGRLYRNDLEVRPDGTRTLRFTDVTAASRIVTRG
jgi:hypothetical protein